MGPAGREAEGEDAEDEEVDAAPARVNAALQPPSELRELRGLTRIGATFTSAAAATDITRTRGYRKRKTSRPVQAWKTCESPNPLTSDPLYARCMHRYQKTRARPSVTNERAVCVRWLVRTSSSRRGTRRAGGSQR